MPLYLLHFIIVPQKKCDFLRGQLRLTLIPFLVSVSSFTAYVLLQATTARRSGDQVCPCARGRRRSDAALANRRSPSRRQGKCFPWTCGVSVGIHSALTVPYKAKAKSQLLNEEHATFILKSFFFQDVSNICVPMTASNTQDRIDSSGQLTPILFSFL